MPNPSRCKIYTLRQTGETGNDPKGITMSSTVKMLAEKFLGMKEVEDKTTLISSGGDFSTLNEINELYNAGYDIIMFINSEMFTNGSSFIPSYGERNDEPWEQKAINKGKSKASNLVLDEDEIARYIREFTYFYNDNWISLDPFKDLRE